MSEFDELERKLRALSPEKEASRLGDEAGQYAIAMRMSVELLAGVAVGGFLGFAADRWLETSPWMLVVGIFLGFAAGILNMKRAMDLLDKGKN